MKTKHLLTASDSQAPAQLRIFGRDELRLVLGPRPEFLYGRRPLRARALKKVAA
jgi:hypothetical protein